MLKILLAEEIDLRTARDISDLTVNKISNIKTVKEQQNDQVFAI